MKPREPSPDWLASGLARIAAPRAGPLAAVRPWRYATIGLAALLSASVVLNAFLWQAKHDAESAAWQVSERYGRTPYVAYTVLRPEGDTLVRETRYEYTGRPQQRKP
jgi:hypothetical protein